MILFLEGFLAAFVVSAFFCCALMACGRLIIETEGDDR